MDINNDIYRKIHFAIMAIVSGARKLGISGKEMHERLSKQGLIQNSLFKRYEELHTQSLDWVANDNVLDNFDQTIESYSNEKKITTHIL